MCSNHSRALLLLSVLVLCGCEAPRAPKTPISYRQRTNPPPRAAAVSLAPAPASKPQPKPARPVATRPANARPAGAQSVVYRREDTRPQAKVTPRAQPSGVSLGKLADEGKPLRQEPAPVVPPVNPQGVRPEPNRKPIPVEPKREVSPAEPKRKDPPADEAKLKALYDSGFLTREEFLRAGNGK